MTIRKAAACAIAFPLLLLTAACFPSQYGPVTSAHFERTVKKSLTASTGEIHEFLRSNWIPYKKKKPVGGIFVVADKGLVFAVWDDPINRYKPRYAVAYDRLSTVRLKADTFRKKLRAETRSGRVDYFEILTQGPKPPYVVNNDLTEDVFGLLKKIRREQASKQRPDPDEIDFQRSGKAEKKKPRKRRASKKRHRRHPPSDYDDY